jgi:hypothetical protein
VVVLAILGGGALVASFFRSVGRALLRSAEVVAASAMAETGARRGDLTGMQEGRALAKAAGADRARATAVAAICGLWLAVPLALGEPALAYAVAAPLWLLPRAPRRSPGSTRRPGTAPP